MLRFSVCVLAFHLLPIKEPEIQSIDQGRFARVIAAGESRGGRKQGHAPANRVHGEGSLQTTVVC